MNTQTIAMYSLLAIGIFVVVSMVYWMFKSKDGPKFFSVMLVFLGFGMMGVGGFGPAYLNDYVGLVNALRGVENTSGNTKAQTVAAEEIIQKYAKGAFTDQDWWIISATLKENAVPELDRLLEEGAQAAIPSRQLNIENTRKDVLLYEAGIKTTLDAVLDAEQSIGRSPEDLLNMIDIRTLMTIDHRPELIAGQRFFHGIPPERIEQIINERRRHEQQP